MTDPALPVMQQAPGASGACCAACAAPPTVPLDRPSVGRRPSISRSDDRQVTFGGLLVASAFLALAVLSLALPDAVRRGAWLPLHLLLAGAAGTAIASVLPFFTAALAVAAPVGRMLRIVAIVAVAAGAATVSLGVAAAWTSIAVAGGLVYVGGIGAITIAAFAPLRGSLGPRRRLVEVAYASALAQVTVGAVLATTLLAGWAPVVERWLVLKPAHGWLNVFGFLAVVIAASLIHLAPTVSGTRIRPRRSALVGIAGLVAGPPLIALGIGAGSDLLARLGALSVIIGGAAFVVHAAVLRRDRGHWTTDAAWHRFTEWSLIAAPTWFLVAVAIAGGRVLWLGADPASWSIGLVAAPLAIGGVAQVLVGSWSHLVPAIGPGDSATHARQRSTLGIASRARLLALNGGVALLTVGLLADLPIAIGVGGLAAVVATVVALILLAWTALAGIRIRAVERPAGAAPIRP